MTTHTADKEVSESHCAPAIATRVGIIWIHGGLRDDRASIVHASDEYWTIRSSCAGAPDRDVCLELEAGAPDGGPVVLGEVVGSIASEPGPGRVWTHFVRVTFVPRRFRKAVERRVHGLNQVGSVPTPALPEIDTPELFLNQVRVLIHELRSMLAVAFTLAECDSEEPADAPRRPEDAKLLLEALGRAVSIVERISAFSRGGAPRTTHVPVSALVEDALRLIRVILPKSVQITASLASKRFVVADTLLMGQVLINLVRNACEAMMEQRNSMGQIEVRTEDTETGVRISVSDNGPGIPAALALRVFERDFTTRAEQGGFGVGLTLSREIVTRHGGEIRLDSCPTGTTVLIDLPTPLPASA